MCSFIVVSEAFSIYCGSFDVFALAGGDRPLFFFAVDSLERTSVFLFVYMFGCMCRLCFDTTKNGLFCGFGSFVVVVVVVVVGLVKAFSRIFLSFHCKGMGVD
jgi:hypothetical protein